MKKIIIISLLAILPAVCFGQNAQLQKLFDRYSSDDNATCLTLGGATIKAMLKSDENDADADNLKVSSIKLITLDKGSIPELSATLTKPYFSRELSVKQDGDNIEGYFHEGKGKQLSEAVLYVTSNGSSDGAVLIWFLGTFTAKDLSRLSAATTEDN